MDSLTFADLRFGNLLSNHKNLDMPALILKLAAAICECATDEPRKRADALARMVIVIDAVASRENIDLGTAIRAQFPVHGTDQEKNHGEPGRQ